MSFFITKIAAVAKLATSLIGTKYFVVIAEVFLMTVLTLSSFSILVRLTDVKTIGLWVLLNSLLSFSKIADFWSAGLVTFVAEDVERGDMKKASQLVSTSMLTAATGFFGIVLVVSFGLSFFANSIPGVEDEALVRNVLPLMGITFWLITVAATYQVGFLGFNKPLLKLFQNVGGSLVFLILSIVLVPHYGLWGILLAQTVQGCLMLLFGVLVFHGFMAKSSPLAWSKTDFKRLTRYGSKASAVGFLQLACDPLIRLLASHFGGLAAVTLIELATRMIVAVRGLIMSVGQLLVPAFARASLHDDKATARLYANARQVFVLVTIPVLSSLLCVAPVLEWIMLGTATPEFLPMVWMLSLGWGVNIITAPAFFLLTGRRRLRPLFWNRLVMLMAVFIFGFLGGQFFGILGVTLGVTVGLIAASLLVFRAAREFELGGDASSSLSFSFSSLIPLAAAAVSTASFLLFSRQGYSQFSLTLLSGVGVLLTLGSALATTSLDLFSRGGVVNTK